MSRKLGKNGQDTIVSQLGVGLECLSQGECDELYEQLDAEHQIEMNDSVREFADIYIGSTTWDSDE